MKKFTFMCILVVLGAGSSAFATYTSQIWHFDTQDPSPAPDVVDNHPSIGPASLAVTPGPQGGWIDGAWELSGEIDVIVENNPVPELYKTIRIELLWRPGDLDSFLPKQPLVGVTAIPTADGSLYIPMADMEMVVTDNPLVGSEWTMSVYDIIVRPNPAREWIAIKGNIVVDDLKIETECIPEPATMGLLGLGSLALLRFRRKS